MIRRIFVEKKKGYDVEAKKVFADITNNLGIQGLTGVRLFCRYDVSGLSEEQYNQATNIVFSEPPVDDCYHEEMPEVGGRIFAIEFLPGQYDQRADSAMQCIQILTCGDRPKVKSAKVYVLEGNISDDAFDKIKGYMINPVEARQAALEKPETLDDKIDYPEDVKTIDNFITCSEDELVSLIKEYGLAMDEADIKFCREYFKTEEKRNPTLTEIRMIDTYWSDHCRHTTFGTVLDSVEFGAGTASDKIEKSWNNYLDSRKFVYGDRHKDICLMDVATLAMKKLKKQGALKNLDESEEINACSIVVDADIDGKTEQWLVMFKNETHNHPTEIEPFGGAATCLGGAIRDPLSGRSYVYQAMRVTGSADPRKAFEETIPGKLSQRKITTGAASGYSSYGNQIGLATGLVDEVYNEGYVAKRLEIGAVIGACPKSAVRREVPADGDLVILLGGKTGRDGCGGATGSSKAHTEESLETCGAEVQKGNPPIERKIQRLFRNQDVTLMIKRCNDFGAGGVSVAIGELADGLYINLDSVPKKYEGLDGTELAISESQERMAVVVEEKNAQAFIAEAAKENLEATIVARVTEDPRLVMVWRGNNIVNVSREFLSSNGAPKNTTVSVSGVNGKYEYKKHADLFAALEDLNQCCKKGLIEMFDSTIGANTVLMPFGGKHQLTPADAMAAKLPVLGGNTTTASLMAYGLDPDLATWSPYHGSMYSIVHAVSKIVAAGGKYQDAYLTLQEYFERLGNNPTRWGKPLAALLGAYESQMQLGIAAIGGKDSMSGTFKDIDVPPTLAAFAVTTVNSGKVVSNEFKKQGSKVVYIKTKVNDDYTIDFDDLKKNYDIVANLIENNKVLSAMTVGAGGIAPAIAKMAFGNKIGFKLDSDFAEDLYAPAYGSFILEVDGDVDATVLGSTTGENEIVLEKAYDIDELIARWRAPLEKVFPTDTAMEKPACDDTTCNIRVSINPHGIAKPRVFIPVFPGTNCEYDSAKAFEKAGATAEIFVVKNLSGADIEYSLKHIADEISKSQIVMLPGGFSGGDEPDGSGKFIAAAFRNPYIKDAVNKLLKHRDGLMLGICNGFQALIKLGLVPYGEITDLTDECPTLTYNNIGRHASCLVNTKVASVKSPWMSCCEVGDIHRIAISHGEGKFVCSEELYQKLAANGQIATRYVDDAGNPTYDIKYNPNGSVHAVEGIFSSDGRVFGKMGHSERTGDSLYKNVPGNKNQPIFESGVKYFK